MEWTQNIENIPNRIRDYYNFIPVAENKAPTSKDWTNEDNWAACDDIEGKRGFVLYDTPFLVLDFDHLRESKTAKMKDGVKEKYWGIRKEIQQRAGGTTYTEYSCSGCGLHMIFELNPLDYPNMVLTGGEHGTIPLVSMEEYRKDPKQPKLELYYGCKHQFIFTGNLYAGIQPKQGIISGEAAANVFLFLQSLLEEPGTIAEDAATVNPVTGKERENLLYALNCIDPDCEYGTWIQIGKACKNAGLTLEDWDRWSKRGKKYTAAGDYSCDTKWKTFKVNTKSWNAGTIVRLAKESGNYSPEQKGIQLIPENWGDIDQGRMFAKIHANKVRYTDGYGWLVYTGDHWEANEHKAMGLMQQLADAQLQEAKDKLYHAQTDDELKAAQGILKAAVARRNDKKLCAGMAQAIPMLHIKETAFDSKPYLLNTPAGTVDLKTGVMMEHDPKDYMMKITGCSPSSEGAEEFDRFLTEIANYDDDLKLYLQTIAGMCIIGMVFKEALIIAYGKGGNGKSTFFNLLADVLGDYSGKISSDILIVGNRKNTGAELAELKGKRFVIAAELREGTRLDTGTVKNLCSTDDIQAEKKYKDPFHYKPSHHCVLYTNNLPKVGTADSGTWDRLIVIPFNGRFRNTAKEIPNYAAVLYEKVGGACLQWMIDGARMFIENGYKLTPPQCVVDAVAEYEQDNDWITDFVTNCCDTKIDYKERASNMYTAYQQWCFAIGERPRDRGALKYALEKVGFLHKPTKTGKYYFGLQLKAEVAEKLPQSNIAV